MDEHCRVLSCILNGNRRGRFICVQCSVLCRRVWQAGRWARSRKRRVSTFFLPQKRCEYVRCNGIHSGIDLPGMAVGTAYLSVSRCYGVCRRVRQVSLSAMQKMVDSTHWYLCQNYLSHVMLQLFPTMMSPGRGCSRKRLFLKLVLRPIDRVGVKKSPSGRMS